MRINTKQSLNRKEMLHNLVGCATKLWSKYAKRSDAYLMFSAIFMPKVKADSNSIGNISSRYFLLLSSSNTSTAYLE